MACAGCRCRSGATVAAVGAAHCWACLAALAGYLRLGALHAWIKPRCRQGTHYTGVSVGPQGRFLGPWVGQQPEGPAWRVRSMRRRSGRRGTSCRHAAACHSRMRLRRSSHTTCHNTGCCSSSWGWSAARRRQGSLSRCTHARGSAPAAAATTAWPCRSTSSTLQGITKASKRHQKG